MKMKQSDLLKLTGVSNTQGKIKSKVWFDIIGPSKPFSDTIIGLCEKERITIIFPQT